MVAHGGGLGMSCPPDASPSRQITVVDVYDLASAIGKDFEKLIDQFGTESVRDLMPKVISSLETLESLASRNDKENEEIMGLKKAVERLEAEKQERLDSKKKFEQELEHIEENYKKEITELWDMVQNLQGENKRLAVCLDKKEPNSFQTSLREEDLNLMLNLQGTVDNQRDQIKSVQKDSEERQAEVENLQVQVEKLNRVNKELSRKIKAIQNQGRSLVEEKAELINTLHQREQVMLILEQKLGETEKAKKDLEQTKVGPKNEDHFRLGSGRRAHRFALLTLAASRYCFH